MPKKEAYSEDAQRLEAIINTATDGIIIINHRGIMESVNPAAATLFGYQEQEMIGKNVSLIAASPHKQVHDTYLQNYLSTGIKKIIGIGREVNGQKKDGSFFPLRLSISEVKLENRIVFTGILHDLTKEKEQEEKIKILNQALENRVEERTMELEKVVNRLLKTNKQLKYEITERKLAEEELRKKEKEARSALLKERELSDMKSRFVTMASHEFRTPLSAILTSSELLDLYLASGKHEKCGRNINRIKNAVNHLTSILDEFLSLSKLEANNIKSQPIFFNFDEFAAQLIESLKSLLKQDQQISYQGIGPSKDVYLDKKFLNHTLTNLLSNAIKYSNEGQTIHFTVSLNTENLIIQIKDEGIGIPESDQKYLFGRFFRAHNVENIQGTGLGLNIVKKYIDLMNGKIDFFSKLGKGTTFTINIPLVATQE